MKRLLVITAWISYLCLAAQVNANEQDITVGDRGKAIQQYVDELHQNLGFSGVVLVAREGKVIAEVARGTTNHEQDGEDLTSKTLFEIASCTKPFTAIAILQLAEQGQLSLDDSIGKYLPNVPVHSKAITIRQLLSHTSGIPGTNTQGSGDNFNAVVPTFFKGGPKHTPGSHFEYWNQGYSVLSEVIAQVSGESYTETIRKNILQPCGMTKSCFTGDPQPNESTVAIGTSTYGKPRSALEHPYGSYGYQYRGMGGLVTNIEDLWRWDRALHDGKLLNAESVAAMIQANQGGYGLGWFVAKDPGGAICHRHGGSVRGFLAEIRRYPAIDGTLIVLANQDESLPFSLAVSGLEQLLFDQSPDVKIPTRPSQKLIDQVTGEYQDAKKRRLAITKAAGLPTVRIYWGGPVTAGYLGMDDEGKAQLYLPSYSNGRYQFQADGELEFSDNPGKADSVSLLVIQPKLTFRRIENNAPRGNN